MPGLLDLRVGIDVGGTNTDAVILDRNDRLLGKTKTPTTADVTGGISKAFEQIIAVSNQPRERITHVMLGTTHATNAILERRDLLKVAVIRIGAPATCSIPPLIEWPRDLRECVSAGEIIIEGGSELTGEPIVKFDTEAFKVFLESVQDVAQAVSVTSVFSPVCADHEFEAEAIVKEVLGQIPITLSGTIGSLGLLERENACVLNSALIGVARHVVEGLVSAIQRNNLFATAFLTQNDGTLMSLDSVLRFPVLTIGSGPANSMRGAAYLTKLRNAVVIDIGGTSTDIGLLFNGFPRESTTPVNIGGVRTNFRMPDLVSIAVGGGTVVTQGSFGVEVGPTSVGYRIIEKSLVFGGDIPTLSDAAVLAERLQMGVKPVDLKYEDLLRQGLRKAEEMIWDACSEVQTSKEPVPYVVVGGGSVLLPETGLDDVVLYRPEHFDVANAIGAAIASVSGQVDKVYKVGKLSRDEILEDAKRGAIDEAILAGSDPSLTEIIDIEEVPMAYLTEPVIRIRVKAAGPLSQL